MSSKGANTVSQPPFYLISTSVSFYSFICQPFSFACLSFCNRVFNGLSNNINNNNYYNNNNNNNNILSFFSCSQHFGSISS